jgi:hypothetical protein
VRIDVILEGCRGQVNPGETHWDAAGASGCDTAHLSEWWLQVPLRPRIASDSLRLPLRRTMVESGRV